jgi:sulfide:quinone oxidoreductase
MDSPNISSQRFRVVIAGGGVAALEAALALRDLAGDLVTTTLIAPEEEFVYRPMTVREPFAYSAAMRYPIAEIARDAGAELRVGSLKSLDPARRTVQTETGEQLRYDALLLGLGARAQATYEPATTLDDKRLDEVLHGLVQDVEGGYAQRVAFVIPGRAGWPLPIYELALFTARRAYDMNVKLAVTIATPEDAPLAIFGDAVSAAVAELLERNGITTITSAYCEVPDDFHVDIHPGNQRLEVNRIVALPELFGPSLPELPGAPHGFIPVDAHCQVAGVERVYAAGDVTDFAVKHGGIAAQQADTATEAIAALAGAPIEPRPFHPVLQGVLLGGDKPLYLSAEITGGRGSRSQVSETPAWAPPTKIAARYLAPYLDKRDRAEDGSACATSMIRIVLADDHAVVRHGLRLLLDGETDFEVVAEAGDVEGARRYTHGHRPAVLVLDLNMPGGSSLTAIPEIRAQTPETQIVVLTMQDEPEYAREALAGGAIGYVLKEAADAELVQAVRLAAAGEGYLNPRLGARVAAQSLDPPDDLSDRELDVLRLIALGYTNVEIAGQTYLSVRTVETHRSHILQKLRLSSRSELVRYALDRGLVEV